MVFIYYTCIYVCRCCVCIHINIYLQCLSPQLFAWNLEVHRCKAKYRVELPGYPILGDGKSEPGLSAGEEVVKLGSMHLILTAEIGFMVDFKNDRDRVFAVLHDGFQRLVGRPSTFLLIHSHPANKQETCNNLHLYFLPLQEQLM